MTSSARVRKHRAALGQGRRRVEVVVPSSDAELVKNIAQILRTDPQKSSELRQLVPVKTKQDLNQSAAEFFDEIRKLYPPGSPLDLSRDDLLPDRDFSFD